MNSTTSMHARIVKLLWAGRMSYKAGLHLQQTLVDHHLNSNSNDHNNTLVVIEHDPVYTIGIRDRDYTDDEIAKLKSKGADFFKTNRGGLITFHGPGQLVAYPILNLKEFKPSVKWYVCQIEKMIIRLCAELGIKGETSPHTGVWVNDKKICAIGIHGKRYITSHGLALNCNTDLEWFNHIVPCGIEGKEVTSISKELNADVTINDIIPIFKNAFTDQFQCKLVDYPPKEASEILRASVNATKKKLIIDNNLI
ncbi:putative lipoyltransferase 2, mitochondrial [Chelonus insularis]|uniref:putative lipoyltransferase 2, mitochondrial n=1 Tax=Chelonus insularis TaxID=460826 RepID=UPI00158D78E1|nr:putative lipoyltransferase 2, mitochondrial [Chelonus insularis]